MRRVGSAAARAGACGACLALALTFAGAPPRSVDAEPAPIVTPAIGGAPWTADEIAKLDADLDALLEGSAALRGAHAGVVALDTASGAVLYARHADDAFQPASTLKLVAGSAALDRLGPAFRFRSALERVADGSRPASFVFRMGGDPTLSPADLAGAADAVAAGPVGAVYVDDSAFERAPYPAGWTWDDFGEDYAAPVSAATLNENVVDLVVTPGARAGDAAAVRFADGRPFRSASDGCAASASVVVAARATTGAPGSDDTIDAARTPANCPEIVGSIPLGAPAETVAAAVASPVVALAEAFRFALAHRHVPFASPSPTGPPDAMLRPPASLPAGTVVWTHESAPLAALLGPRFWIPSDNLFGELLVRELGLRAAGKPGTTDAGTADEKAWLASIGVDPATVSLADGCGMSQYDRITPRDLVAILQHDWNGPNRGVVLDSLPVGGARGTIEGIAGTPAAGRVFAKTGSMRHVRGLAGYLATERHGAVTFAFEVDDWLGDYPALAATRAAALARIVRD
jgi:D-alanyl-D-alanine carboxypeptidase/D-alanyl-D-alanine-endopeptidase (penicillin-binding protein 4)